MARHKSYTRACRRCGGTFETKSPWVKLCDPCKKANKLARDRLHNGIGQGRKKMTKHDKPKPAPQSTSKREALLNERQRRLDAELDARLFSDCASSPARVIRPGDPEFEAIAREVTQIERVPDRYHPVLLSQRHYLENGGFSIR